METTSHNTTTSSLDEEFMFDIHGSRYIRFSEIKQPTPPKSVKDDLPPYVFRSNAKLFMGVWHNTTEYPVLEIIEDMYEPMCDVLITHADEDKVLSMCTASTNIKAKSVYDYIEFLKNWTELKCFRHILKPIKKFSSIVNKRSSRYKYYRILISSTLGFIKTSYYDREY